MNMMAKKIGIGLLTAATAIAPLSATTAQAGDYLIGKRGGYYRDDGLRNNYDGYGYGYHHYGYVSKEDDNDDNKAVVLGIIGLGVGAIIGSAIANNNNQPRVIYPPRPAAGYYPNAPRVISGGNFEPWSKSWYRYCTNRYRTFNSSTGTYRGYDGRNHFCVAR